MFINTPILKSNQIVRQINKSDDVKYASFGLRLLAYVLDMAILIFIFAVPILMQAQFAINPTTSLDWFYSISFNYIFPMVVTVMFWRRYKGTPGKIILHLEIVDEKTLAPLSYKQSIIRYFAYIPAMLPLFAGFFWVIKSAKGQGWHDLIARTVVTVNK